MLFMDPRDPQLFQGVYKMRNNTFIITVSLTFLAMLTLRAWYRGMTWKNPLVSWPASRQRASI